MQVVVRSQFADGTANSGLSQSSSNANLAVSGSTITPGGALSKQPPLSRRNLFYPNQANSKSNFLGRGFLEAHENTSGRSPEKPVVVTYFVRSPDLGDGEPSAH